MRDTLGRIFAGLVVLAVAVGLTFVDLPSILSHSPFANSEQQEPEQVSPRGTSLPGHRLKVVQSIELLFSNGDFQIIRFVTADAICYLVQRPGKRDTHMELDCEGR